jgi:LAGLIDADG endonuclease
VSPATEIGEFIGGFVAGEGTFGMTVAPPKFTFSVQLGGIDEKVCDELWAFFGVGHVHRYGRRKAHYDDEVHFTVRKVKDLVGVVVPFMDEHLPPSYKRQQYEAWRTKLVDHWQHHAKRRRTCTLPGCDRIQKGRGVCRRHYYQLYGV